MKKIIVKFITLMLYSVANDGKFSGRADGNVYMRNGRIRGFKVPALVQNAATSAVRQRLAFNSSDWNAMADIERASWNGSSGFFKSDRFGRVVVLKGKGLYVSLNNNLHGLGLTGITVAPIPSGVEVLTEVTINDYSQAANLLKVTFVPSPSSTRTAYQIAATAPLSAGTSRPSSSKYRVIDNMPAGSTSSFDFSAAYILRYGTPPLGAKIFFRLTPIDIVTGQAGAALILEVPVVA